MRSKNDTSDRGIGRRTLLKRTGVALTGVGFTSTAVASRQSADELYRAAREVRNRTDSVEKFRNLLRSQGARVAAKDVSFTVPWDGSGQSSDGVSAQKLDQADCTLSMTMTIYTNIGDTDPFVDLDWEHTVSYTLLDNDVGERPYDIVGLSWEQRDYDLKSDSWYGGNSTWKRKYSNDGVAFNYDDAACVEYEDATGSCTPQGETFTIRDSCGCQVIPDETSDASLRTVYADYWHTYKQTEITSVSISSSGEVSVTLSDNTYRWLREDDISEDEAVYKSCC